MATVTGTIEAISTKYDKFSILVNDVWYGTKFEPNPKPNRGDEVSFDDGGRKYINKLTIVGGGSAPSAPSAPTKSSSYGGGFPVDPLARERSIIRQNSLAHATQVVTSFDPGKTTAEAMAEEIVKLAQYFERYSAGDMDREEAEALKEKAAA